MSSSRNKPGVAFWATVVGVVGLLYLASFGPACWVCARTANARLPAAYYPLTGAGKRSDRIANGLIWYANLGTPEGAGWYFFGPDREFMCFYLDEDDWEWADLTGGSP